MSTGELDALAEQVIRDGGGVPSFLGYHGYPASICASVNEQIVHGIPSAAAGPRRRRPAVGRLRGDRRGLARRRRRHHRGRRGAAADLAAVGRVRGGAAGGDRGGRWPAARLTDVSHAVQTVDRGRRPSATASTTASSRSTAATASARRCTWTRSCPTTASPARARGCVAGHGAGHRADADRGRPGDRELDDGWTVVTADGSRAAHWEHSVAVTDDGPRVLTLPLEGLEDVLDAVLGVAEEHLRCCRGRTAGSARRRSRRPWSA